MSPFIEVNHRVSSEPTKRSTMERITTHGRFKELIISIATDVLPEPEPPATPMMLMSAQGGE